VRRIARERCFSGLPNGLSSQSRKRKRFQGDRCVNDRLRNGSGAQVIPRTYALQKPVDKRGAMATGFCSTNGYVVILRR